MIESTLITLFTLFTIKHFIVDFWLQKPYHYENKGTYGHMGGIAHAVQHGLASVIILLLCDLTEFIPFVFLFDTLIHYHIDWAKMNLNKYYGWGPLTSENFWIFLGLDQMLHQLTYVGIIVILLMYGF